MMTIWKYPIEVTAKQLIAMPEGAKILTVQTQDGRPCLWALVDPERELKCRLVHTVGTGQEVPLGARHYVGTYQLRGGLLVYHVFIWEVVT